MVAASSLFASFVVDLTVAAAMLESQLCRMNVTELSVRLFQIIDRKTYRLYNRVQNVYLFIY